LLLHTPYDIILYNSNDDINKLLSW
jgi:hypothetical protein